MNHESYETFYFPMQKVSLDLDQPFEKNYMHKLDGRNWAVWTVWLWRL